MLGIKPLTATQGKRVHIVQAHMITMDVKTIQKIMQSKSVQIVGEIMGRNIMIAHTTKKLSRYKKSR